MERYCTRTLTPWPPLPSPPSPRSPGEGERQEKEGKSVFAVFLPPLPVSGGREGTGEEGRGGEGPGAILALVPGRVGSASGLRPAAIRGEDDPPPPLVSSQGSSLVFLPWQFPRRECSS